MVSAALGGAALGVAALAAIGSPGELSARLPAAACTGAALGVIAMAAAVATQPSSGGRARLRAAIAAVSAVAGLGALLAGRWPDLRPELWTTPCATPRPARTQ